MVEIMVAVHTAPPEVRGRAFIDDYAISFRDAIAATLDGGSGDAALGRTRGRRRS